MYRKSAVEREQQLFSSALNFVNKTRRSLEANTVNNYAHVLAYTLLSIDI